MMMELVWGGCFFGSRGWLWIVLWIWLWGKLVGRRGMWIFVECKLGGL